MKQLTQYDLNCEMSYCINTFTVTATVWAHGLTVYSNIFIMRINCQLKLLHHDPVSVSWYHFLTSCFPPNIRSAPSLCEVLTALLTSSGLFHVCVAQSSFPGWISQPSSVFLSIDPASLMVLNAFWYVSRSPASHRQFPCNFFPLLFFSRKLLAGQKGKQNDSEIDSHLVCASQSQWPASVKFSIRFLLKRSIIYSRPQFQDPSALLNPIRQQFKIQVILNIFWRGSKQLRDTSGSYHRPTFRVTFMKCTIFFHICSIHLIFEYGSK